MQLVINFMIENIAIVLSVIIVVVSCLYYRKNKRKISQKIAGKEIKVIFSKKEYKHFMEQAESVLNNTTISFSSKNINKPADRTNLYYSTVSVGNQIIKSHTFTISDVGEI